MTKQKLALVLKLAEKLSDETLSKLAAETLSLDDIKAVKTAGPINFMDSTLNALGGLGKDLGASVEGPAAGPVSALLLRNSHIPGVLKDFAVNNKALTGAGLGAGALGTIGGLYLAHKALQNMYGGSEDSGNERLASAKAELPVELRAQLDKLAEDPGVAAACYTFIQHGLI
jgi:hypothetical protein